MKMDRRRVTKKRISDPQDNYVPGTMEERIEMVWPLTVEALSLSKRYDTSRKMQRHITRLIRREG